jgi:hypothetical protein
MAVPSHRRRLAAIFAVLAVAASLTGCTSISDGVHQFQHTLANLRAPRVGQCWKETYDQYTSWYSWKGSAPVDCATDHEIYTYAVRAILPDAKGSWKDSDGIVRSDVDNAAYEICQDAQTKFLPGLGPRAYLLYPNYLLPSVAEWKAGAHWVRCDIAQVMIGSEIAAPKLQLLPFDVASLVNAFKTDPKTFDYCVNDSADVRSDPLGDHAVYADCERDPDWTLVANVSIPDPNVHAYPGKAALQAVASTECDQKFDTATRHTLDLFPTKTMWNDEDNREVECWLSSPRLS